LREKRKENREKMSHKEIISSRLAIASVPAHLTAAGCRLFSCSLSRTPRDGHSKC
jgi:hypothetical protein